jgi:hypothetical protein
MNSTNTHENLITAGTKIHDIESIASEYSDGLVLKLIMTKDVQSNGNTNIRQVE